MASSELLIKINADAKNAKKAYDDLRAKTEDLEDILKGVAIGAGVAFAALTAEIYFSVKAFDDAQKSAVQLSTALQNQGIYTKDLEDAYKGYADAVQEKTGIDNDAIIKAQAVAQTYLGQTKISKDLTFAIANLAATMGGDLNGAAEKIGRTIGTGTNAFVRSGLTISATATEAERLAKVLEFVRSKSDGLAAQFNKADGYTQALATSFGNLQEKIGERFSPVFAKAREIAIGFFDAISKNQALVDFIVAALAAATAVAGIVAASAFLIPAFFAIKAAALAAGTSLSIAFVGIPLAIGLVVFALTELYLNWKSVMDFVRTSTTFVVTFVTELFGGLSAVVKGVFDHFNVDKIKAGIDQIKNANDKALDAAVAKHQEIAKEEVAIQAQQDADKKKLADKAEAEKKAHQDRLVAIERASMALIQLQNENASTDLIALKTKEIEILKALDSEKTAQEKARLTERLAATQALIIDQQNEDLQRQIEFEKTKRETLEELRAEGVAVDDQFTQEQLAKLRADTQTEKDLNNSVLEERLKKKQQANAQEKADTIKYGADYAKINKALNTDQIKATSDAAGQLVALSNSKNAQLKAIGKAAAITQIGIDTAKGAMAVYANFQTAIPFPPVSIPLGIAAAAALTLYGAERIGQVTGAAEGGLLTGGFPGRDSIPVLAQAGELIAPAKNFEEVVGAVQASRAGPPDNTEMVSLLRSIDQKFSNPQQTVIQGDVSTDQAYIDALVRRISDAVQYRNAQIFGVTA